jgi:hypothetical protein
LKTKKVLALVVLAAMLVSIMPMMAFGDSINTVASTVTGPDSTAEAKAGTLTQDSDGAEFDVVVSSGPGGGSLAGETLYVSSSRNNRLDSSSRIDAIYYEYYNNATKDWKPATRIAAAGVPNDGVAVYSIPIGPELISRNAAVGVYVNFKIKVVTNLAGKADIVFGTVVDDVSQYANGKTPTDTGVANIIGRTRYPIEFTPPDVDNVTLTNISAAGKYANGVDYYELEAFTTSNGVPAAGKEVQFSVLEGVGVTLSASRLTTTAAGKAVIRVTATSPGVVRIEAKSNTKTGQAQVVFDATGITNMRAEEDVEGQKIARNGTSSYENFSVSVYDGTGNRLNVRDISKNEAGSDDNAKVNNYFNPTTGDKKLTATIVTKPSGAALEAKDILYGVDDNNNATIRVPREKLSKDGDYEVRAHLNNGVSVSFKFSAKNQGDITVMELSYPASAYAAGTILPNPSIKYKDAEGYSISYDYKIDSATNNVDLSISDASFIDGGMGNPAKVGANRPGAILLKEDKSGVIVMTAVDTQKKLVGTKEITVLKPASYLKITPQGVGTIGGEVYVDIELVDVDGKPVSNGLSADSTKSSATIISRPEGAVASASTLLLSDFNEGKASVRVISNMEGDVTLQVIITETSVANPKYSSSNEFIAKKTAALKVFTDAGVVAGDPVYDAAVLAGDLPALVIAVNRLTESTTPKLSAVNAAMAGAYSEDPYIGGGKTFTGAGVIPFGTATATGNTVVFIIGSPTFVSGSNPYLSESPAFVEGGRTFLGVRDMGTAINAAIEWDQDSQTATLNKDGVVVRVTVGASAITLVKNGVTTEVPIDAPAQNKDGRVYLPFRAVLEAFGYDVTWDQSTQSIVCKL